MSPISDDEVDRSTEDFIRKYADALKEASEMVVQRGSEGRNGVISLPDMFLGDPGNIAFLIYMKTARVLGECDAENYSKVREELIDIINYAGFGIALIDLLKVLK